MKRSERIQKLVALSQKKEDNVARLLARQKQKVEQEKQKLEQLQEYASQYESERNLLGLSPYLVTNYQHFVSRLEQAVQQQKGAISQSEHQADQAQLQWLQARAKTKSMDLVKGKHAEQERRLEEKQEQKQFDEFAMLKYMKSSS
ncbi:hypothetical protein MED121_06080 [Marinomonas sp. MED121]|uniref:flagellar export protein FliJ n=1 Tax=Marinomonas sp. MED121 TaxID=314277 RepID=UPI0000690428|nr:flagellar export protein FliJ [Marinomonas sp. MED121]EAQ66227.1 hypothetical protein MED121_06080 [Marinomonas sp. MED121]